LSPTPPTAPSTRPHCRHCGQELTGTNVEGACPSCGEPVWEGFQSTQTSGMSIASLVLGVSSIVGCVVFSGFGGFPLGVLAIVFGEIAHRQHKSGKRGGATYGLALAGRITGLIGAVAGLVFLAAMGVIVFMGY